jgi:hypothetical protein
MKPVFIGIVRAWIIGSAGLAIYSPALAQGQLTYAVTYVSGPAPAIFNNPYNSNGTDTSNTNWGTNSNAAQIASVAAQVGAFALAGNADSAVLVSLQAGAYTVQVSGVGNTTGVALAEVYEVSSTGTRLVTSPHGHRSELAVIS